MVDTHCHFDMMPAPEAYIARMEAEGNLVIGVTNCPEHFNIGYNAVCKYKHIRLALGFHPLLAKEIEDQLNLFQLYVDKTSYIGEIGLDFSREGILSKHTQLDCLHSILTCLKDKNKIISVHSRNAERELLDILVEYNIKNVIFHWYTGKLSVMPEIIQKGYYFSVNEAMTRSVSGKKIIEHIPVDRILTETDAPFNRKCDLLKTYQYLAGIGCSKQKIYSNFTDILKRLDTPINRG